MIVRVFVPRAPDAADSSTFSAADHNFPVLPSVGHVLRFTDERKGEFTIARVGFVQEGKAFLAAAWLERSATQPAIQPVPVDQGAEQDEYRDLNYDVPPESMTSY